MNINKNEIISIVIPIYNEESCIDILYHNLLNVINVINIFEIEVIFIDDGSQDGTLSKLLAISKRDKRVVVLEFSRNFGKEAALSAGIDFAKGDAVIFLDCDLQDPPILIKEMIEKWVDGAEVVLAHRVDRTSDSFFKRKSAELFYWTHNKLSKIQIPKNVGDFRLIDRAVVNALKQLKERERFMKGLFAWAGFKTITINYVRNERASGATKFNPWSLWNFAIEGITSFSTVPLRFWLYMGIVGSLSSIMYILFIIMRTLLHGIDIPGYASLLTVILFFGSLQLIGIGVLGEYIGRTYIETKQRPLYILRKKHQSDES